MNQNIIICLLISLLFYLYICNINKESFNIASTTTPTPNSSTISNNTQEYHPDLLKLFEDHVKKFNKNNDNIHDYTSPEHQKLPEYAKNFLQFINHKNKGNIIACKDAVEHNDLIHKDPLKNLTNMDTVHRWNLCQHELLQQKSLLTPRCNDNKLDIDKDGLEFWNDFHCVSHECDSHWEHISANKDYKPCDRKEEYVNQICLKTDNCEEFINKLDKYHDLSHKYGFKATGN